MNIDTVVVKILNGDNVGNLIEGLLDERSIWSPSRNVHIPFKQHPLKIPGGMMGVGAAIGAGYKGYVAHRRAKKAGLKGKHHAKAVAKALLKGAAGGAAVGYAGQLAQRVHGSRKAELRHVYRRATKYNSPKAIRKLKRREARANLAIGSATTNILRGL